jgi:phage tail-like protein
MLPGKVKAESNPRGGQIDLSWSNPREPAFKGIKIVRREATFPDAAAIAKDVGIYNAELRAGEEMTYADEKQLKSETVYYYAVAAYDASDPPNYFPVFVSAMSTTDYGSAAQLFENLPSLYRRADTLAPPNLSLIDAQDRAKGQLRRLLDMFGMQFDMLRSYAAGMRNFHDIDRVDGQLLPLLAQWIGWQTDFGLPLVNQRNELKYATHFYRTNGIAANLRAMINRLTTWDAQVKEFVHSILLTNNPERLTLWRKHRHLDKWDTEELISPHVAYEGRPCVVQDNDEQQWLFYHAREDTVPSSAAGANARRREVSHLWLKQRSFGEWLPARRITFRDAINKYPAAVRRRGDGSFLVFYSVIEQDAGGQSLPQKIKLSLISSGRPAQPARIFGTKKEPFALSAEETLIVSAGDGANLFTREVVFHEEDFQKIGEATAAEVAAILNREVPGVSASVGDNNSVALTSIHEGGSASMTASGAAAQTFGLPDQGAGEDASTASVTSGVSEPFALRGGATLSIKIDHSSPKLIVFDQTFFEDISRARASEVAEVINREIPGSAQVLRDQDATRLKISSAIAGTESSVLIDVDASSAAPALGFGVPLPPSNPPAADTEPAAFADVAGNVWLFWSSLRAADGKWSIWYNCLDAEKGAWQEARQLTSGRVADKQPAVLFGAGDGGRIWVFWSGKRRVEAVEKSGAKVARLCWNIFYRSAPNTVSFEQLKASDWTERELNLTGASAYDNQEPAVCQRYVGDRVDPAHAELYFTSSRADGLSVWSNIVAADAQGEDVQITQGEFTQRAPAVASSAERLILWYRSNATQVYSSSVYFTAKTYDARHSGSTTIDTRNSAKLSHSIRRGIDDITHYTYDTARKQTNWYSRDTVGVYLTPDTTDKALIIRKQSQLENFLQSVLPIQVRPVLIIQEVFPEKIYTYDYPKDAPQVRIREYAFDARLREIYKGLSEGAIFDRVNFRWMRTWARSHPDDVMPDTHGGQPKINTRLFLKNVKEGTGGAGEGE